MDLKCSMGVSHSLITLLLLQVPPLLTPFLTTLDTNWIRENSSLILKPISHSVAHKQNRKKRPLSMDLWEKSLLLCCLLHWKLLKILLKNEYIKNSIIALASFKQEFFALPVPSSHQLWSVMMILEVCFCTLHTTVTAVSPVDYPEIEREDRIIQNKVATADMI